MSTLQRKLAPLAVILSYTSPTHLSEDASFCNLKGGIILFTINT